MSMDSANKKRRYVVTYPLTGWSHAQTVPCIHNFKRFQLSIAEHSVVSGFINSHCMNTYNTEGFIDAISTKCVNRSQLPSCNISVRLSVAEYTKWSRTSDAHMRQWIRPVLVQLMVFLCIYRNQQYFIVKLIKKISIILIEKMSLKMSSATRRPFCAELDVLKSVCRIDRCVEGIATFTLIAEHVSIMMIYRIVLWLHLLIKINGVTSLIARFIWVLPAGCKPVQYPQQITY